MDHRWTHPSATCASSRDGRRAHRDRVHAVPRPATAARAASATTTTRCSSRRARQLAAYFARDLKEFDLPLAPGRHATSSSGCGTQLRTIGYGETASYGEIAGRLGMTNAASRAVGLANGRNPIPIVIPCHRVIGANGTLTGYAGGLERKQALLELEQPRLLTRGGACGLPR